MTSSLILHSYRRCPFAIRVRMVLEEKSLPYQLKEENLNQFSPEILQHHPEGRVPLLIHHKENLKHVLYQSSVITEYLEEAFPNPPRLVPVNAWSRAEMRLWTYWCDSIFKPDLDLFKYETQKLSPEELQDLHKRLHQHLSKVDHALKCASFLIDSTYSLADIHLFPFFRQFYAIRTPLPGQDQYSHLIQWLRKFTESETFKKVMNPEQTPPHGR